MDNLNMDLTGKDKNFSVSNRIFRIFKHGQYVNFETPIFKNSLKVQLLAGAIPRELVLDQDYVVPEQAVASCDNDMSSAKLLDSEFSEELISGIQMNLGADIGYYYTISVSYQRLYPNQIRTAFFHDTTLEVTPELISELVSKVEELSILSNRVIDTTALTANSSIVFDPDPDKTNDLNYVEDEVHELNVPNRKFIINPLGGSFYADSVTIKYPATGETLVLNKDYYLLGMDEAKTKITSHTAPVYKSILVSSSITDKVLVSYHAFGGEPTIDNYKELLQNLNNVTAYLNNANNLTSDTLGRTEVLVSLYERIGKLEDEMRRLLGTPSYGDITSGKAVKMKLFAPDSRLHWYTIAKLYTVNGSTVPCTADTFMFRLQSEQSHFQFTATATVDLNNQIGDRFNTSVICSNYPRGYTPFIDYSSIERIIRPELRVVWMNTPKATGAYLQLGFELKNMMEETICIEDLSGTESAWKLIEEVATVTQPEDDDIALPDNTIWNSSLPEAQSERMMIPLTMGHLAWAGAVPLNRPIAGWSYFEVTDDLLLNQDIDFTRITKLRIGIEETDGLQFGIDVTFDPGQKQLKGHASFTHQSAPAYINAAIYKVDNKLKIRLDFDITAGTESNQLTMRHLVVW